MFVGLDSSAKEHGKVLLKIDRTSEKSRVMFPTRSLIVVSRKGSFHQRGLVDEAHDSR